MKHDLIKINGSSLPVREFEGQRVVTVSDIATVHQLPINNIQRNFANNRKRFIANVDYFQIRGKKAMENISISKKRATLINVFTESGYLMLVKSLTDDLSWQVQRELVNGYFKAKVEVKIKRERISKPVQVLNMFSQMNSLKYIQGYT